MKWIDARRLAPEIEAAIKEGAKAGAFWRAARLNPRSAATWTEFGLEHHGRARMLLADALKRLGKTRVVRRPGTPP